LIASARRLAREHFARVPNATTECPFFDDYADLRPREILRPVVPTLPRKARADYET